MRGWERAKWVQTQKEGRVYLLLRGWGTGVCGLVWQPQRAVHGTWEGRASVTRAPVKVGARTDREASQGWQQHCDFKHNGLDDVLGWTDGVTRNTEITNAEGVIKKGISCL